MDPRGTTPDAKQEIIIIIIFSFHQDNVVSNVEISIRLTLYFVDRNSRRQLRQRQFALRSINLEHALPVISIVSRS